MESTYELPPLVLIFFFTGEPVFEELGSYLEVSCQVCVGGRSRKIDIATLQEGIDRELAKNISTLIKKSKLKVQSSIQGDSIRVAGKKRDDLQEAIQFIKEQKYSIPLQFDNFRD